MNLDAYRRLLAGEQLTFVLSPRALWRLTGPDRVRYLNGQVTNDVAALASGHGCYAAVCTAKGRMEGDLHVAARDAEFYLDAGLSQRESLGARLEKYLIADDAVFEDVTDSWKLSHVFGETPPPAPPNGFVIAQARFGLPGHDLWVSAPEAAVVGESVEAAVIETLRLEQAIPLWGAELTTATLPPEAGPRMLQSISYTKGCYVGQETIARLKSVGHVNRTLVFLKADTDAPPAPGTKLAQGAQEAGVVTSSGYSPRLNVAIALGYVQRQFAGEGTRLLAAGLNVTVSTPLQK
jgi:folate-binding protein YgfZ